MTNVTQPIALPVFSPQERIKEIMSQLWHRSDRAQRAVLMECAYKLQGEGLNEDDLSTLCLMAIAKGVRL